MIILKKELKYGLKGFLIWTGIIAFLLVICIFLYPSMESQMAELSELMAQMGIFSSAFGLDRLDFGTLIGFYGTECTSCLGIGGGLFVGYLGMTILLKEEGEKTAEFLLTHPVSRLNIVLQKLLAGVIYVIILNAIVFTLSIISIICIGEPIPWQELIIIHLANFIMQIEIFFICFGISAFLRNNSMGIGMGLPICLYFLNIIKNISSKASFLKYITPYAYTDSADIINNLALEPGLICLGIGISLIVLVLGIINYTKKDILV